MAVETDVEYPQELETDRDITPLSDGRSRLPTVFFAVAAGAGLLLLLLLQLFDGDDADRTPQREVFRPNISDTNSPNLPVTPITVDPAPTLQPSQTEEQFNILELERQRQLALLEEQRDRLRQARREAEREEQRRRRQSTMLVVDNGGSAPTTGFNNDDLSASDEAAFFAGDSGLLGTQDANLRNEVITDRSERFLRDASNIEVVRAQAVKLANQDYLLTQGTFISGVLETMINSDLPGLVRALVDKPVYSRTGDRILVPKGSRLIGRYQSGANFGQARVYIVWSRLERPDGVVIKLGSPGTDTIGQAGLGGDVDNHFFQRFGASTLFSTIGPAISLLLDDGNASLQQQDVISGARDGFNRSAEIALQNSINIPPTIRVPQGTEITIFVNRDLSFADVD